MDQESSSDHFVLNEPPIYGLRAWNGDQYLKIVDIVGIVRPDEKLSVSLIHAILISFQALARPAKEEVDTEFPKPNVFVRAVRPDNSIGTLSLEDFRSITPETQDLTALYIDAEWGKRIIAACRKGAISSGSEYLRIGILRQRVHRARLFKRDGGSFTM